MSPEHRAALAALPRAPGLCPCGEALVLCVFQEQLAEELPWGCPECNVRIGVRTSDTAPSFLTVLRHPADPHWAWVPPSYRAAVAKAGLGFFRPGFAPAAVVAYSDHVWFGDEHAWVMTPEPMAAVQDFADRLGIPADYLGRHSSNIRAGLSTIFAGRGRRCWPRGLTRESIMVGSAHANPHLISMVEQIHPGCAWHTSGALDPLVAAHAGRMVGTVMPMRKVDDGL